MSDDASAPPPPPPPEVTSDEAAAPPPAAAAVVAEESPSSSVPEPEKPNESLAETPAEETASEEKAGVSSAGKEDGNNDTTGDAAADAAAAAVVAQPGAQEDIATAKDSLETSPTTAPAASDAGDAGKPPLVLTSASFDANYCQYSCAKGEPTSFIYNVIFRNTKGAAFSRENVQQLLLTTEVAVCFRGQTRSGEWKKGSIKLSLKDQPILPRIIDSLTKVQMVSSVVVDCRNIQSIDTKKNWTKALGSDTIDWKVATKKVQIYIMTAKNQQQVNELFEYHSAKVHNWRARCAFICFCCGPCCCYMANHAEPPLPRLVKLSYM